MKTDYQKQGADFLTETGTTFKADFVGNDYHFDDDKEKRDIYRVTLERNGRKYSFRFGQSIVNSRVPGVPFMPTSCDVCLSMYRKRTPGTRNFPTIAEHRKHASGVIPTAYDVLSCLTKSDPGSIDDFASEYGYSDCKPSKIIKTYNAVVEEWKGVSLLFSDVMDKLQEVQ